MKFYLYKIGFNADDGLFEYEMSEQRGTLNTYYNTAEIGKNSYPLNKVLIEHSSLQEIRYVSDSKIIGDAKSFLMNKYCNEIDETITFLQGIKNMMGKV